MMLRFLFAFSFVCCISVLLIRSISCFSFSFCTTAASSICLSSGCCCLPICNFLCSSFSAFICFDVSLMLSPFLLPPISLHHSLTAQSSSPHPLSSSFHLPPISLPRTPYALPPHSPHSPPPM